MNFTVLHPRRCAIFFLTVQMLFCMTQTGCNSRIPKPSPVSEPEPIQERSKLPETLTINGETFIIPPPWTGNRFTAPEFDPSDFLRIPGEYTHNDSKVYILVAAHRPLVSLLQAAEEDGISLKIESAYRSPGYQKRIFKRMLAEGRTFEDIVRYVAPPGYSQHMLGTAVDFFPSDWSFVDTAAYSWLQENGRRFGFEETYSRFNPMKMPWEAWHWNFTCNEDGNQTVSDLSPTRTKKKPEASLMK